MTDIGRDIEKGFIVMLSRETLSLRATDHGVIAQEYTNGGRALLTKQEMKAKDLMMGDYITIADSLKDGKEPLIFKVVGVGYDGEDSALVLLKGEDACDIVEIDDEWCGIPITPEILEKNGFIYNDLPFVQAWEQFGLALYIGGNGYRIGCGNNVALIIDSVHELQHALKLCRIDKEIVV